MDLKFVSIFVIFWLMTSSDAQFTTSATCSYGTEWLKMSFIALRNNSYYSCNLNTRQSNENLKISRINGQHHRGYNDNYVNLLTISYGNKLKLFSPFFCQKFPNLQIINTVNANLLTFDRDSLEKCQNLIAFSSSGNRLHVINGYVLYKNPKLIYISLEGNQLNLIPENLFLSQREVVELNMRNNDLTRIPMKAFSSLTKLQFLTLENNSIYEIQPSWFYSLQNLKILILAMNRLWKIPQNTFMDLVNLESLSISSNSGVDLYSGSFTGLKSLRKLGIDNCSLTELPENIFTPLVSLEILGMETQELTTIHSDSFGYHRNLTLITLRSNPIDSVDERILDKTALSKLFMAYTLCSNADSYNRNQIRENLRTCFNKYQPRSSESESYATTSSPSTVQTFLQPSIPPIPSTPITPSYSCGHRMTGHGNIIGGSQIARGDHPWLAALVMKNGKYFCGGNLITTRKVLSAAHCIQDKHTAIPTSPQNITVLLGAFDLDKTVETGRQSHAVQSINIHPDWNTLTESFDADLSVLVLESEALLSRYIQPVCLFSSLPNFVSGVVVGYGKSEDGTKIHENIPRILNSQIHNNPYCFQDNRALARISSGRTFCGGPGRGIGVCNGDSGSGLYVTDGTTYYLRGVVSSSLIGGPYGCDVDTYSVFTDVLKFVDWINGI
ncbi:uncharacterized protein [Chironomus tepperi]|uniref:uncharacterized protein n=1 Tax=Chironomus tepperi TaxID=113505 RepID=UPI00391EFCD2